MSGIKNPAPQSNGGHLSGLEELGDREILHHSSCTHPQLLQMHYQIGEPFIAFQKGFFSPLLEPGAGGLFLGSIIA